MTVIVNLPVLFGDDLFSV